MAVGSTVYRVVLLSSTASRTVFTNTRLIAKARHADLITTAHKQVQEPTTSIRTISTRAQFLGS